MQEANSDEIDLVELIEIIWGGKWLITAITGAFAILSVGVMLQIPPSFEGSIDIVALDKTQIAGFAPLNDTPGISQPIYSGYTLIGQKGVILSEDLFKAFVAELDRGQFLSEAYAEIDPDFINYQGTETEKREALSKLREDFGISIDKDNPLRGTLEFSTGDKELARAILTSTFAAINENVRVDNLRGITNLTLSMQNRLNFEIDKTETAIANAIANYKNETAASLAQLTEQAAIARQLGIADNQAGLAALGANGIGINVNSELPLYLRGFKALEKEIALINSRGTGDALLPYVPNYPILAAQLRTLTTDKRLERIEKGIALTPLVDTEKFIAVRYDLETVIFKSSTNKRLIVILATLMGGVFGVIFVLIRHLTVQRKQNA
jgi:LPS O-antigen subunit length determinant protein (WzzB/FepE family)